MPKHKRECSGRFWGPPSRNFVNDFQSRSLTSFATPQTSRPPSISVYFSVNLKKFKSEQSSAPIGSDLRGIPCTNQTNYSILA